MRVSRGVVEHALASYIIRTSRFRVEFETDESEALALDHSLSGEASERFSRIRQHFIIHRGITVVIDL